MDRFNHLKLKELEILKQKITTELRRIESKTEATDIINVGSEVSNEADMASNEYANSQMLRMQNRDLYYYKKLFNAEKKFESKEYGLCEECGDEIKSSRLMARPTAELCIVCKEESEENERSNIGRNTSFVYREEVNLG